jgi:hypothetical protein
VQLTTMLGVICAIPVLIFLGVCYAIAAWQLGHKVALKRLPILLLCLAAALGFVVLLSLLPSEWQDYALSGFLLMFSFYMGLYLAISLKRRAQAGETLLEIGRPRGALVIGVVGAGCGLLVGAFSILKAITDGQPEIATQIRDISSALFWISLAGFLALFWLSKWSIREAGIIVYGVILKWGKIEGFHWDEDKRSILALKVRRRFPWWPTVKVPVPSEKQEAVTDILQRHISANSTGDKTG